MVESSKTRKLVKNNYELRSYVMAALSPRPAAARQAFLNMVQWAHNSKSTPLRSYSGPPTVVTVMHHQYTFINASLPLNQWCHLCWADAEQRRSADGTQVGDA